MSGGSYDYKYIELDYLREISKQCHDIEWIDSCDYGPEEWALIEEFLMKHNF